MLYPGGGPVSGVAPPSPGASPSMPSFFGSPSTAAGMGGTATAASPSNLMQQFERRRVLQCMLHSKAFEGEGCLQPTPALLHSCPVWFAACLMTLHLYARRPGQRRCGCSGGRV